MTQGIEWVGLAATPTKNCIFIINLEAGGWSRLFRTNALDFSEAINGGGKRTLLFQLLKSQENFIFLLNVETVSSTL